MACFAVAKCIVRISVAEFVKLYVVTARVAAPHTGPNVHVWNDGMGKTPL